MSRKINRIFIHPIFLHPRHKRVHIDGHVRRRYIIIPKSVRPILVQQQRGCNIISNQTSDIRCNCKTTDHLSARVLMQFQLFLQVVQVQKTIFCFTHAYYLKKSRVNLQRRPIIESKYLCKSLNKALVNRFYAKTFSLCGTVACFFNYRANNWVLSWCNTQKKLFAKCISGTVSMKSKMVV